MPAGIPLTDEQRARVISLDAEGRSASKIAAAMLEEFGIVKTRNAIIGVLNRSGVRARREPRGNDVRKGNGKAAVAVRTPPKRQSRVSNNHVGGRALRPATVAAPVAPVEPPPVGGVGLLDLQHHHCRAILGRGADGLATFCGISKSSGSYCAEHGQMFYAPASSRKEAA